MDDAQITRNTSKLEEKGKNRVRAGYEHWTDLNIIGLNLNTHDAS